MMNPVERRPLSRRTFLRLAGLSTLVAACGNTPTPEPTATSFPTRTPTPTLTFTPSVTYTPSPTLTFTPYPTLTPSITPFGGDQVSTPVASGCVVPEDWQPYSIQPGDTLVGLSLTFGVDMAELATLLNQIAGP